MSARNARNSHKRTCQKIAMQVSIITPTPTCTTSFFPICFKSSTPLLGEVHLATKPPAKNTIGTGRGGKQSFHVVIPHVCAHRAAQTVRPSMFPALAHTIAVRLCLNTQTTPEQARDKATRNFDCEASDAGVDVAEWKASNIPLNAIMGRSMG